MIELWGFPLSLPIRVTTRKSSQDLETCPQLHLIAYPDGMYLQGSVEQLLDVHRDIVELYTLAAPQARYRRLIVAALGSICLVLGAHVKGIEVPLNEQGCYNDSLSHSM